MWLGAIRTAVASLLDNMVMTDWGALSYFRGRCRELAVCVGGKCRKGDWKSLKDQVRKELSPKES